MAANASFSDSFVLFVCFVVHRSPRPACLPWAHSSCRGEQVGPAERANHSGLNWKVTCGRPVTWVDRSTCKRSRPDRNRILARSPVAALLAEQGQKQTPGTTLIPMLAQVNALPDTQGEPSGLDRYL
jgi:hypothetical protein